MKNINLLLPILFLSTCCAAQGVFSNQTNYTLEQVIQDYPSQFNNIKGELLSSEAGSVAYKSTISIPGAVSTTIIQSITDYKPLLSWESVLYKTNDFNAASRRFEQLFNQIKNTIIKPQREKAVIVNGLYTNPSAEVPVNIIQFNLLPATGLMQKMAIDLAMQKNDNLWTIVLRVYDKDRKEVETKQGK